MCCHILHVNLVILELNTKYIFKCYPSSVQRHSLCCGRVTCGQESKNLEQVMAVKTHKEQTWTEAQKK